MFFVKVLFEQFLLLHFRNREEVDDLEDPHGVDEEYRNEPPRFFSLRRVPQGKALPHKRPRNERHHQQ